VSQNTDCSLGTFETNPATGTCMFDCEYDNRYVAIDTLSFDFIREECDDVNYAAMFYPSECSSLADLVWPASSCDCPSCICSSATTDSEYHTHSQLVSKTCVQCTCAEDQTTWNDTELVFTCDYVSSVHSPETWNDFSCPPTECTDSDGGTHPSSTSWWQTATDGTCQRCYCTASGTSVCATGYSDILASSNEALVYEFRQQCDYYLRDCMDDDSRMFDYYATSSWSQCDNCPRCDCGSHEVGESWYTKYQDLDDELQDSHSCVKCSCIEGTYGIYTDCDWVDGYSDAIGACPPDGAQLQCHDQYSSNDNLTVDATLSPTNCSDYVQPMCGWSIYEDGDTSWGCQTNLLCEAYIENNACIYYDTSATYTDCDGVVQTETIQGAYYCCNTENCNHQTIDTSTCSRSTAWENVMEGLQTCVNENSDCITEADNVEITCDAISTMFQSFFECYCTAYGAIYARLSSSVSKLIVQDLMDGVSARSTEWNDFFGCDINWSCNLEGGGVIVDSPTSRPSASTTRRPSASPSIQPTEAPIAFAPSVDGASAVSKVVPYVVMILCFFVR